MSAECVLRKHQNDASNDNYCHAGDTVSPVSLVSTIVDIGVDTGVAGVARSKAQNHMVISAVVLFTIFFVRKSQIPNCPKCVFF